nr:MAG TPA: hypothetical protein [Caudoviricetes sp.]
MHSGFRLVRFITTKVEYYRGTPIYYTILFFFLRALFS